MRTREGRPSEMSEALHDVRRQRLSALLAEQGWDAVLAFGNAWHADYLRYASDFAAGEGDAVAVFAEAGATRLFVESPAEAERAEAECPHLIVDWAPTAGIAAAEYLARMGNLRVAAAPTTILPYVFSGPDAPRPLADASAAMDRLLVAKAPEEIEAIRRAAHIADRGYRVFMEAARPGRAEFELVADIEAFFRAEGCPENFMIMGSGGQEVRGMSPAGERRLQVGDLVTTELTPCLDGYYAQICRTLVIGPPSAAQMRAMDVYIEAAAAGEAILKAGGTAAEVARAENDVFRAHGLGDYTTSEYTRVRGHGVGLFVDTKPHILEDVELALTAGATVTVHPNTYHPEVGYMVLGDTSVVTEEGCEVLIETPRELLSVPK